jgi:hypothetical protein
LAGLGAREFLVRLPLSRQPPLRLFLVVVEEPHILLEQPLLQRQELAVLVK